MRGFIVMLVAALPLAVLAQVPNVLGYQGRLLQADGTASTGVVAVTFAIYEAAEGGPGLWTETQQLALTDGFYATHLGQATPLPAGLFDGGDLFLQVTVDGDVLMPRQRIGSVAYALTATDARNVVGGAVDASSLSIGGNPVIDGSGALVGSAAYTAGSGVAVSGSEIGLTSCGPGEILKSDGSAWACGTDDSVTPQAGEGIAINGGIVSLGACPAGQVWKSTGPGWGCAVDADTATVYAAGSGLVLNADTFAHADTSAQAAVNGSGGTVVQDLGFDEFGHVASVGSYNLDGRYFTESESDGRYVNVTGDTMTGSLAVQSQVRISQSASYDVWIQGGTATSGEARNLALLGVTGTDRLHLNYGGEYTGGVRVESGALVTGELQSYGLRQVNTAAPANYTISTRRYIVEASPARVGQVVPVNQTILESLCRDYDGCKFTMLMYNYAGGGEVASRESHLFLSMANRRWRFTNDVEGIDANGGLNEWAIWDCYFTDAENMTNTSNGRADTTVGFGLLNVRGGSQNDTYTTCRMIFED